MCLKKKGHRRATCFEIFHQISDLSKLKATPPGASASVVADPKDKEFKITQTTIYCSTCQVSLCLKKKGRRRASCFEIFHQISDLKYLKGMPDGSEGNTGSSKKRKASSKDAST